MHNATILSFGYQFLRLLQFLPLPMLLPFLLLRRFYFFSCLPLKSFLRSPFFDLGLLFFQRLLPFCLHFDAGFQYFPGNPPCRCPVAYNWLPLLLPGVLFFSFLPFLDERFSSLLPFLFLIFRLLLRHVCLASSPFLSFFLQCPPCLPVVDARCVQ